MRKIMVVDDDSVTLLLTKTMLKSTYEIVSAESGKEALALFEREKPELVLSDLLMPEMDGYELHRRLQEISAEPVPIIFMTSDVRDESESRSFQIGAADYIRKPVQKEVLLQRVGNVLEHMDELQGLRRAVVTDPMTGLYNKSAVQDMLTRLCREKQGILMMIDLDSFKLVNDLYGHGMGDRILLRFSELLKSAVRTTDIIGRIGGDEFLAFCQNVADESIIAGKADYLNWELMQSAREYMGEDMQIPLGVSIGAVMVPDEGTSFDELYRKADQALYTVKQGGKHWYAFFGSAPSSGKENKLLTGLSEARMILGERSPEPGAMYLDFDRFQAVYRMTERWVRAYDGRHAALLQFTLRDTGTEETERFRELLTAALRRSDCVTQNGNDRFLVLLVEAEEAEAELIRERIRGRWGEELAFEVEEL